MAKMIPPFIHAETPASEARTFQLLSRDPGTESWTVLHSLGLASRGKRPFGEIDFVILVPDGGVVCMEVKGGRVRCEDGVWYTRDRRGQEHRLTRSPFMQLREAVLGLREQVQQHFGTAHDASALIFTGLVVLPDVTKLPESPEYHPWELADSETLRSPISRVVSRVLEQECRRLQAAGRPKKATGATLAKIRNYLRPDFDVGIARSARIGKSEDRIVRLTEEQYDTLDLFELNSRCLVEGAAGTGKTMLALESARRAMGRGLSFALLCFNRLLGDWLSVQMPELGGSSVAGSYYSLLRRLISESPLASEFSDAEAQAADDDLYSLVYPLYGQLALAAAGQVDVLIVDEAQDLLSSPALSVFSHWLKGGLAGGRWVMLGDFNRQAIFSDDGASLDALREACPNFTHAVLKQNCRNTRAIGEETALLSGFQALPYRLDREDSLPVDYRYCDGPEHAAGRLAEVLDQVEGDGVAREDIVVLSPRRFSRSIASRLPSGRVVPIDGLDSESSAIRFCTIHRFKGLESPVVVVCDVDDLTENRARSLMYVGMSRARSQLVLLLPTGLQSAVAKAIGAKLNAEWRT